MEKWCRQNNSSIKLIFLGKIRAYKILETKLNYFSLDRSGILSERKNCRCGRRKFLAQLPTFYSLVSFFVIYLQSCHDYHPGGHQCFMFFSLLFSFVLRSIFCEFRVIMLFRRLLHFEVNE